MSQRFDWTLGKALIFVAVAGLGGCNKEPEPAPAAAAEEPESTAAAPTVPGKKKKKKGLRPTDAPAAAAPAPGSGPVAHQAGGAEPAPVPVKSASRLADRLVALHEAHASTSGRVAEDTLRAVKQKLTRGRCRTILSAALGQRDGQLMTIEGATVTEQGKQAIELLRDVEGHGLDPAAYPLKDLEEALKHLEAARAATNQPKSAQGVDARIADALGAVVRGKDEPLIDVKVRLERALLQKGLSDDQDHEASLAALEKVAKAGHELSKPLSDALADVEVAVARGFCQYALDFKYMTIAHPFRAMESEQRGSAIKKFQAELTEDATAVGNKPASVMKGLWPKHPFYVKAHKALARYRELAAKGTVPGWKVKLALKKGMKGPNVVLLKQRLAAEGFFSGDLQDEKFDDDLVAAVKRYQLTHQLDADGIVGNNPKAGPAAATAKSLDVPMEARVRQLKLSMQRWRESKTGKEDYYFRVNIPQFEVEVWDGGKIARTHRVITGNNNYEVDEEGGRRGHLNRTMLFSNALKTVVINPVWHVPSRIKTGELDVEAEKDPDYYEKHNFRKRENPDGTTDVYQMPGSGNALGRVKLLFPNPFSVYMHDTPKKKLFDKTLRAFSHGCMRLDKPVDMAKFLLERDGSPSAAKVDDMLSSKAERGIQLKKPVPIHIEYNTVAFREDSDDPIFLNDVYQYDASFWNNTVPFDREARFTPKVRDPNDGPAPDAPPFPEGGGAAKPKRENDG